jgi:hypothetical protein
MGETFENFLHIILQFAVEYIEKVFVSKHMKQWIKYSGNVWLV